jgi:SH3 domain protein
MLKSYAFHDAGESEFVCEFKITIQGVLPMPMRMKTGLLVLLCMLLLGATVCAAESLYISEDFEITMRTGPGTDHKIIAMVPSGRLVEVLSKGDDWSQIQLPNGKQGWVLTRYLTDKVPSSIQLSQLESKHATVLDQNKTIQQKLADLTTENRDLNAKLKQAQAALATAQTNFEGLKKDSANFIKFKSEYEKNRKELTENREKAQKYESQLNRLASSQLYEGMLYGGGLIIFGFLAGFILKKPKRRSGLM